MIIPATGALLSPSMLAGNGSSNGIVGGYDTEIITDNLAGVERGEPMNFKLRYRGNANPYYTIKHRAQNNCYSCAIVDEARARGFDVEAILDGELDKEVTCLANGLYNDRDHRILEGFTPASAKNIYGITNPNEIKHVTAKEFTSKHFGKNLPVGRYEISCAWKGHGNFHVYRFEKLESGEIQFYDPQNGQFWLAGDFPPEYGRDALSMKYKCPVSFFRTDDKPLLKFAENFVRQKRVPTKWFNSDKKEKGKS